METQCCIFLPTFSKHAIVVGPWKPVTSVILIQLWQLTGWPVEKLRKSEHEKHAGVDRLGSFLIRN